MKTKKGQFLLLIRALVIALVFTMVIACGGGSGSGKFPNGVYQNRSRGVSNMLDILGSSFVVKGKKITVTDGFGDSVGKTYEYEINEYEIKLTLTEGDNATHSKTFEKKDENTYLIGGDQYVFEKK